jgi:hypothetical protein
MWLLLSGFDGLFLRTLRDLTIRPGYAAKKYIQGNRSHIYGPLSYFFLMITLFLLLMSVLDISLVSFINEKKETFSPSFSISDNEAKFVRRIMDTISRNMKAIAFLVVPFQAVAFRYMVFRKSGLNFMESMVMPFYLMGHLYWLSILSAILYYGSGSFIPPGIISMAGVIYFGYAYSNFIDYQPRWKTFLKGSGVYLAGQLSLMLAAFIVMTTVIVILAYYDPEIYEMLKPSGTR